FAGMQPLGQNIRQRWKIQQEVLSLNEFWGLSIDLGNRVNQINRVKLVAAVIALITASSVSVTNWALAFDVAVRQGAACRRGNRALHGLFDHITVVVETLEQFLGNRV